MGHDAGTNHVLRKVAGTKGGWYLLCERWLVPVVYGYLLWGTKGGWYLLWGGGAGYVDGGLRSALMSLVRDVFVAFVCGCIFVKGTVGQQPDSMLRNLPPGVYLDKKTVVPAQQLNTISRNLGGRIQHLTNAFLRVQGRPIQVNLIESDDTTQSRLVYGSILKLKPFPFCHLKDNLVIEFVGKDIDEALALKTSFELGILPKPRSQKYRISARVAIVDDTDYMACNRIFNQLLAIGDRKATPAEQRELSRQTQLVTFGQTLALRHDTRPDQTIYETKPQSLSTETRGSQAFLTFSELPKHLNIPYVDLMIRASVDDTGLMPVEQEPSNKTVDATKFWPSSDERVRTLVADITAGKTTNETKVEAILAWLAPGANVKYSGETGSRYGTLQVLQQRFGHCWDFSDCFVTFARAAGVPARQVAGWLYGSSGHVWAEYYRPGLGWQQVDPTGGGKLPCGIYHIPYFTTEDGAMPIIYLKMPEIEIEQN